MRAEIHRPVPDFGTRRIIPKKIPALPVDGRPDRPRAEPAAAVGAHVAELFNTVFAERALERTNHSLRGVWRQRFVAIFAGGS